MRNEHNSFPVLTILGVTSETRVRFVFWDFLKPSGSLLPTVLRW